MSKQGWVLKAERVIKGRQCEFYESISEDNKVLVVESWGGRTWTKEVEISSVELLLELYKRYGII